MEGTLTSGDGLQAQPTCSSQSETTTEETDGTLNQRKTQHPSGCKTKRQKVTSIKPDLSNSENYKVPKQCPENAARERSRVRTLRQAFLSLQAALPSVPPDTKLSKLDVLVLATSYIAHLTHTLDQDGHLSENTQIPRGPGYLHPMKKWPMRVRLYGGALGAELSSGCTAEKE